MATKLTIVLPEELSRRAKARAALEGLTLSAVIRQYLEEFASGLDVLEEAEDLRVVREIEQRLERGEEAVYNWEAVKAELDAQVPVLGGPAEDELIRQRLGEPGRRIDGPSFVAELLKEQSGRAPRTAGRR